MPAAPDVKTLQHNLEKLAHPQYQNDYDQVGILLLVQADLLALLTARCGPEKLRAWQAAEESTFDRFAALLFKSLQALNTYLADIQPALQVDSNLLRTKLDQVQAELAEVQEETRTLLADRAALFDQVETLRSQRATLDALQARQAEAQSLARELGGLDLAALTREVEALEAARQQQQTLYQPLLDRKAALENEMAALRQTITDMDTLLDGLAQARTTELDHYLGHLTGWSDRIRNLQTLFQTRARTLHDDLQTETEKLREVVAQFQQHLQQSITVADQAYLCQEELTARFTANEQIHKTLNPSPVQYQTRLEHLEADIQMHLKNYENALAALVKENEAANAILKPLTF